ncbi:MAG TPA: cell division protein SepF [Acidimicrobiia bacterium]|nr:cell division protein SepF [Acidimicrobiia bacterium]
MAGLWQKTMMYLGLVDEDAIDETEDGAAGPAGPARAPRASARERTAETPRAARSARDEEARQDVEYGRPAKDRAEDGPQVTRRIQPTVQGQVAGRRVEPPLTARRRISPDASEAEAGIYVQAGDTPTVRTVKDSDLESEIITARSYSDAQALADHIRASIPVVLDLRKVEPAMVRRLVDFASGLTYALGGSMRKISQGVILVSPANVNISRSERRRLAELGFYQSPEV